MLLRCCWGPAGVLLGGVARLLQGFAGNKCCCLTLLLSIQMASLKAELDNVKVQLHIAQEEKRKMEEQLNNMEDEIQKERQAVAEEAVKQALSEKEEETKARLRDVREQCQKEYEARLLLAKQRFEVEMQRFKEAVGKDRDVMEQELRGKLQEEEIKRADILKKAMEDKAELAKKQQASDQKMMDLEAEVDKLRQADDMLRKQLAQEGIIPADKAAKVRKTVGTSAGLPEESPLKKARKEAEEAIEVARIHIKQAKTMGDEMIAVQASNFELTKQMKTVCQDAGCPMMPWSVVRSALINKGHKVGTTWNDAWLDDPALLTKGGNKVDNNFNKFKLGRGSYGVVLAGVLDDGMEVAIKFHAKDEDFDKELAYTALCQGPNMIRLLGWTARTEPGKDGPTSRVLSKKREVRKVMNLPIFGSFLQRALVMELANCNCLAMYLNPQIQRYRLGPTLGGIVHAFSLGAQAVHERCHQRGIVHRDLHTSNILLHKARHQGNNVMVLIGDVGMARPMDEGQDYWSTNNSEEMRAVPDYSPAEWEPGSPRVLFKRWYPHDDVHQWGVAMLELLFCLSHPRRVHKGVAGLWPLIAQKNGPSMANIRRQAQVYTTSKALLKFWNLQQTKEAMDAFVDIGAFLLLCCTPKNYNGTTHGHPDIRRPRTMEVVAQNLQQLATRLSQFEINK